MNGLPCDKDPINHVLRNDRSMTNEMELQIDPNYGYLRVIVELECHAADAAAYVGGLVN